METAHCAVKVPSGSRVPSGASFVFPRFLWGIFTELSEIHLVGDSTGIGFLSFFS